jgi:hypothetical protein
MNRGRVILTVGLGNECGFKSRPWLFYYQIECYRAQVLRPNTKAKFMVCVYL